MSARIACGVIRPVTGWPTGQRPNGSAQDRASVSRSESDSGPYRIAGTVAIDGTTPTPVRRRVRLFVKSNGRVIRETWSNAGTGAFEFPGLEMQPYIVMTEDYTAFYNAVVADLVTPVP